MHQLYANAINDHGSKIIIKVNNILEAVLQAHHVLHTFNINQVSATLHRRRTVKDYPPTPTSSDSDFCTYVVSVISASNIRAVDSGGSSDPFVAIAYNNQELTKTKILYKTLNPRWNERFTIRIPQEDNRPVIEFLLYDAKYIQQNELIGKCTIELKKYGDFLYHDIGLNLGKRKEDGKLFLRVMKEGELDELGFYCDKTLQMLEMKVNDMVRNVCDMVGFLK